MQDTPLGQVVAIRSEKDREMLKRFTPAQRQAQAEWRRFLSGQKPQGDAQKNQEALQRMIAGLFGGR